MVWPAEPEHKNMPYKVQGSDSDFDRNEWIVYPPPPMLYGIDDGREMGERPRIGISEFRTLRGVLGLIGSQATRGIAKGSRDISKGVPPQGTMLVDAGCHTLATPPGNSEPANGEGESRFVTLASRFCRPT